MSDRHSEVECYQCGRLKTALSYRSRCLTCETQRADANAAENDSLRARLADAEADAERWMETKTAEQQRGRCGNLFERGAEIVKVRIGVEAIEAPARTEEVGL